MKKIAIILFGILCSFNSFAQKLNEIDDSLAQMFSSLNAIQFADSAALATGSALAKAYNSNENIQSYLISVLRNTPATINADFRKSVNEGLEICPSPDHKVRIYSWNSRENGDGTLKMTRKVYQCGSRSSMCVSEALYIDDTTKGVYMDGLCSCLLSINTIDKKTVYLEIDYHINFPQDHNEIITAFIIDKGRHPLEYDLFECKGKGLFSQLLYSFNPEANNADFSIHFSKDKKTLYMPRTDNKGIFRGYTKYIFNGKIFRAK